MTSNKTTPTDIASSKWYENYANGVRSYQLLTDNTKLIKAREFFEKSITDQPNSYAYRDLGLVCRDEMNLEPDTEKKAKLEEAMITNFEMALSHEPTIEPENSIIMAAPIVEYYRTKDANMRTGYWLSRVGDWYMELYKAKKNEAKSSETVSDLSENKIIAAKNYSTAGNLYFNCGDIKDSFIIFRRAVELNPEYFSYNMVAHLFGLWGDIQSNVYFSRKALEYRQKIDKGELVDTSRQNNMSELLLYSNLLMKYNYDYYDPKYVFDEHCKYGDSHPQTRIELLPPKPGPIRIGYMGGDFGSHQVSKLMDWAFKYADKSKFTVMLYSTKPDDKDINERFQIDGITVKKLGVDSLSEDDMTKIIRDDRLDIFIELMGHTSFNRMMVCKRKPAPVIISYLGYPNTTGIREIDYKFTDRYITKPRHQQYFVEELYNLEFGIHQYTPDPFFIPAKVPYDGPIRFGTLNYPFKFCEKFMDTVCEILRKTPGSTFTVRYYYLSDILVQAMLLQRFKQRGIEESRIDLNYCREKEDYVKVYNNIDVVLNPFPYDGHSTSCEALFMDTPFISLKGEAYHSRVGYGIYKQLGDTRYIAKTVEDYVKIAVGFKREQPMRILNLIKSHPMADSAKFSKSVENAYEDMVYRLAGKSSIEDAIVYYHKIPNIPRSHRELANIYQKKNMTNEAIQEYEKYLSMIDVSDEDHDVVLKILSELSPENATKIAISKNLNISAEDMCVAAYYQLKNHKLRDALNTYNDVLVRDPFMYSAWNGLAEIHGYAGNNDNRIVFTKRAFDICQAAEKANVAILHKSYVFYSNILLYSIFNSQRYSPQELSDMHRGYEQLYKFKQYYPDMFKDNVNRIYKPHKLRVGILTNDFNDSPVGRSCEFMIYHNKDKFDFHIYNAGAHDWYAVWMRPFFNNWTDISTMSMENIASKIYNDQIDILVDLTGHTAFNKLPVVLQHPAPLQLSYLGYPYTSGVSQIQYKLADKYILENDDNKYFVEGLVTMPNGIHCYRPHTSIMENFNIKKTMSSRIRYGSLNTMSKLSETYVNVVCEILKRNPTSVFIIRNTFMDDDFARNAILYKFTSKGIDRNRIDIASSKTKKDYINTYNSIDVVLDPFPYTGHSTTCEALWMGVPIITLPTQHMFGKITSSILQHIGITNTIATSLEHYIQLAVDFDPSPELTRSIRNSISCSYVGQPETYVRSFELTLDQVWKFYTNKLKETYPETVQFEEYTDKLDLSKLYIESGNIL